MVSPSVGATIQVRQDQLDQVTDSLGKKLNFKETKEGSGVSEAKGKDGKRYVADGTNALYTVTAIDDVDLKAARKRNPGIPIPKAEAKKIDEEIKKEAEEAEEAENPEAASFSKRATAPDEGPPQAGRKAR